MEEDIIGTLNEKGIHRQIKQLLEDDKTKQEVRICGYIADIVNDNGIFEIQSAHFDKLRDKLEVYLDNTNLDITIVYPIQSLKHILWMDPLTHSIISQSKSTKKPSPLDIFKELYKIIDIIDTTRIHFKLVLIQSEEYKLLDGYGPNRKNKATKLNNKLIKILSVIDLDSYKDLIKLLPSNLPLPFTTGDIYRLTKADSKAASLTCTVCNRLGLIKRGKRKGRYITYTLITPN